MREPEVSVTFDFSKMREALEKAVDSASSFAEAIRGLSSTIEASVLAGVEVRSSAAWTRKP